MADPAAASRTQPEVGLKERFFRYFQHEVTALQEQMERLETIAYSGGERNDAVDHCLAGIDLLSHEVKDASSYIPAYDQRTYSEAVKALSEKLQTIRSTFNPPKKFTFKSARKNPSAISPSDAPEVAQQNKLSVPGYYSSDISHTTSSFVPSPLDKSSPSTEKREEESTSQERALVNTDREEEDTDGAVGVVRKPSFSNASSLTISNRSGSHIILPTSASHATSSGTVSDLRHCVVDLSPPTTNGGPFASLTLNNIKTSLIICGRVSGPVHITGLENSVIVTASRQFRMHGSKNVDVYLHCSSRPIIEDCSQIRFAPVVKLTRRN